MNGIIFGLTEEDIRSLSDDITVFNRGYSYWKNGYVKKLNFIIRESLCEAIVEGTHKYNVRIQMDENSRDLHVQCECPAHEGFYQYCKHIIATLLKINELESSGQLLKHYEQKRIGAQTDIIPSIPKKDQVTTDRMIQLFEKYHIKNEQQNQSERELLRVEYTCNIIDSIDSGHLLALEMKVGFNHLYIIRNMEEFLSCVSHNNPHIFTKKFTYDPSEFRFSDEDLEIMSILEEILGNEQFYGEVSAYSYAINASNRDRYLRIPPHRSDQLLSKLVNRNTNVENGWDKYVEIKLEDEVPSFDFQLDRFHTSDFLLKLNGFDSAVFLESYGYVFQDGTFYRVTKTQFQMLLDLKKEFRLQSQLLINSEQIEGVISNVVPNLNKIGKVEIAENISDQIIDPPLKVKLKVDKENESLSSSLEYHYGDIVIDPLQRNITNKEQNLILMRNVEKENAVMSLVESTPFKWNGEKLYIDDEYDMFHFLYEDLPKLEKVADIYITTAAKEMLPHENFVPKTNMEINPSTNLFEVRFEMDGIESEEVSQILQSVVEKKKYVRLTDGSFISLEHEDFKGIRQLFDELELKKTDINGLTIQTDAVRGLQMEEIIHQNKSTVKIGRHFRQLLDHIKHPDNLEFDPPESLKDTLRDYQVFGFQWLKMLEHYHFGGILADDMGLGKTIQSISYILSDKENDKEISEPTLIVSPASLIYNWKNEFQRFAPNLNVAVVAGDKQSRSNMLDDLSDVDVVVTSYPLIRRDIEMYQKRNFRTLILDEAQNIKNIQTQTSQAVRRLRAGRRFALSGTPIENSLDELWSIFQVILPGLFHGKQAFTQMSHEKISRMVKPFILRRMKKDVLKELPDKIETLQVSELTSDQKKLYLGYLDKIQQETREALRKGELQQNRMKILAGITRLRQLCCHPSLFIDNYDGSSGKLEQLLEIVNEGLDGGHRILIFSQFTSMLKIIREELNQREIDYFYLDGQTDKLERIKMTERFNQGEKEIFLVSLKAGGTGLNLTGADTVILYDLWWNPAVDEQAVDRAYRIGQKNVVQVNRLITQGTIEEKIVELQQKKKELIEKVIQPGETMLSGLSEDEIKEILSL
ncbi:DEAD/DEAH box helicase [Chengkuizengella axinellae]|uniref:DEAD/DEAH box helicase n=1 Tax=Chengkuizengella axinellae TaxID=3064388 RepID=A0ABT9J067_9BACL|nr:DEAD/DEAH box helicase [Chengkuizengella sp. 2205SS18-9]MDP5275005.1 DEAD/DEAH box helicase [Chengkuizengella sp. 2205SS18-9]